MVRQEGYQRPPRGGGVSADGLAKAPYSWATADTLFARHEVHNIMNVLYTYIYTLGNTSPDKIAYLRV
jgi:hypothetical protein